MSDVRLVRLEHFSLHVDGEDEIVAQEIMRDGVWEPLLTQLVTHEIGRGDVVLDLGAHIGYYTLLFSTLVGPRGRVIAFEPEPRNYSLLRKNVALNDRRNVTTVDRAVSSHSRRATLHQAIGNLGAHSLFAHADDPAIDVECVMLDAFCEGRVDAVDYMKWTSRTPKDMRCGAWSGC
jgi:FkbM family methyltransferase